MNRDEEILVFKERINLAHYAASYGYQLAVDQSSDSCIVMRGHEQGDKVVIKKSLSNHWIYFHVMDWGDNGTIIDFVQNRTTLNLGLLRKALRPWLVRTLPTELKSYKSLKKSAFNRGVINHKFNLCRQGASHYLSERCLSQKTLNIPQFASALYINHRGDAVFPHYDDQGICGYELRNIELNVFSKDGRRTFWKSHSDSKNIFFSESTIDALSFAQIHPELDYQYVSLGGAISGTQQAILAKKFGAKDVHIIEGFDNDKSGDHYSAIIKEIFPDKKITNASAPKQYKDWNQVLSTITNQ